MQGRWFGIRQGLRTLLLAAVLIYPQLALGAAYYIHPDHRGAPRAMTNTTGTVVWRASYAPFGQATVSVETVKLNLRYPGQYFDAETGGHYNYHREYDPSVGRYLQSDPIGLEGGVNTYAYANSNPIGNIDPDGLSLRLAGRVGYVTGQALTYTFTAVTGTTIGIALYEAINGEDDGAENTGDLGSDIAREANRREYKQKCDEPPPPGLDPCEFAKWKLRKAQNCKAAREEHTRRWWGGVDKRHSSQLFDDLDGSIRNAENEVRRRCSCPS